MGITVPTAPANGLEIVRRALGHLMRAGSSTQLSLARSDIRNLSVAAPHQAYLLELENALDAQITSAARLTSWRYMVFDGELPLLTIEISLAQEGTYADFLCSNQGPFVESLVRGVEFAESQEPIRGGSYELRLLEVPSLYFLAIWLHSKEDLFIPLPPPNEPESYSLLTETEVSAYLRNEGERRLKSNEGFM